MYANVKAFYNLVTLYGTHYTQIRKHHISFVWKVEALYSLLYCITSLGLQHKILNNQNLFPTPSCREVYLLWKQRKSEEICNM